MDGDLKQEPRSDQDHVLRRELLAISLTESLRRQIRLLTLRRHQAYDLARAHRRDGQLVPGSLNQEIAENGSQLRTALKQYAEVTAQEDEPRKMAAQASRNKPRL